MFLPIFPRRTPSATPLDLFTALVSFRPSSVERYEKSFNDFLGGHHHCKTVASGRQGLYYLLKSLKLPNNSEVLLSAYNFHIVPKVIVHVGLSPQFCGIDPKTFNITLEEIKKRITENTKVIIVTHAFGEPCEIDKIMEFAKERGIFLIEDCAHAMGAIYQNRKIGTFGDASFFSFETVKHINTLGGGMVVIKSQDVFTRFNSQIEEFSPQKINKDAIKKSVFFFLEWGLSLRIFYTLLIFPILLVLAALNKNEKDLISFYKSLKQSKPKYRKSYTSFQAELGNIQLKRFPLLLSKRQEIGSILANKIPHSQESLDEAKGSYYFSVIHGYNRTDLLKKGIDSGHYPLTDCSPNGMVTPLADNLIHIPISYRMTTAQAEGLGRSIQSCYNRNNG